ncbi:MAG: BamA/TamA family outer membrane protein [Acidobacteriota bacterium]
MKKTLRLSLILAVLLFLWAFVEDINAETYNSFLIRKIRFEFDNKDEIKNSEKYMPLLNIKSGEKYNSKNIRHSMQNLYKIGSFSDIEVKISNVSEKELDLNFLLYSKYKIKNIKINGIRGINRGEIRKSLLSVRENTFLDEENLERSIKEFKEFMRSRGYFNSEVNYKLVKDKFDVTIIFIIERGNSAEINRIFFRGENPNIHGKLKKQLDKKKYVPYKFLTLIEEFKEELKNERYYFPEISVKEVFLNKAKKLVNLYITVNPGHQYVFRFVGIKGKLEFVTSIWKKKVFEKWAERESTARITAHFRNRGYLNAEVSSDIKTEKGKKIISFIIDKNERFTLGKISFSGNKFFSSKILENVITIDDLIFDKIFFLRINSIRVDQEVLKWFYYYKGFPLVKIETSLQFRKKVAHLNYFITEGRRFKIDSVFFRGNRHIDSKKLESLTINKANDPFVQKQINEDIENIRNYYFSNGFDEVKIKTDISPGTDKSILIDIDEGKRYRFGNLIIVGASGDQKKLIRKLFPLKRGSDFNRIKIENFRREIDKSSIFSEINTVKVKKNDKIDLLILTDVNRNKYLGFGIGYEERTGVRFTFEYQKKNIFNSYSTFSALIQVGLNERRGEVSYETPFIFRNRVDSSLKIWEENEIYRSYKFNRYGVSESLIKKLTPFSYILTSLSWYRTKLLELKVTGSVYDRLDDPFDITALNFSYIVDKRDNPFFPTRGEFFSTDVKFAFPVFNNNYSFLRFRWGYQKNLKFMKNGIFSYSVRNGFATNNIPITERFFGGGSSTFRGTRNDKLGSLDRITGEPFGGNSLFLLNLEATFPMYLIPIEDLYYSIFADFGNIYRFASEFSLGNLQKAIGFGLRIRSPIGLLRFDIAYNIDRRENVSPVAFHIGIGNVF